MGEVISRVATVVAAAAKAGSKTATFWYQGYPPLRQEELFLLVQMFGGTGPENSITFTNDSITVRWF